MTCRKVNQLTSKPDGVVNLGQIQTLPVHGLGGFWCRGCMSLNQALLWNVGTYWFNDKVRGDVQLNVAASTNVNQRGGATRNTDESDVMAVEQGGCVIQPSFTVNQQWKEQ